jgi:hypothetical protein
VTLHTIINQSKFEKERKMESQQQNRKELDEKAKQGETVVHGGTGGKSLEAQEHLAEGYILYMI